MSAAERRFGPWVGWLSARERADLLRLADVEPQERWVEYYHKIARQREYVHRLGLKALGVRAFSVLRACVTPAGDPVIDYIPPPAFGLSRPTLIRAPEVTPVPVTELRERREETYEEWVDRIRREAANRAAEARRRPVVLYVPGRRAVPVPPVPVPVTKIRRVEPVRQPGLPVLEGAPVVVSFGRP